MPHGHRAHRHRDPQRGARHSPPDARARRAAHGLCGAASDESAVQLLRRQPASPLRREFLEHFRQLVVHRVGRPVRPERRELRRRAEELEQVCCALSTSPARVGDVPRVARRALRGPRVAAGGAVGRVLPERRALLRDPAADHREPLLERAARRARRRSHHHDRYRARAPHIRAPHCRTRPGGNSARCIHYFDVGKILRTVL